MSFSGGDTGATATRVQLQAGTNAVWSDAAGTASTIQTSTSGKSVQDILTAHEGVINNLSYISSTGDTTDRSTEIVNALTTYGEVRLGAGDFWVSGIIMPDGTSIKGSGKKTVIRLLASVETGNAITPGTDCTIENISLHGGLASKPTSGGIGTRYGIYVSEKFDIMINNCRADGFLGAGLYVTDAGFSQERSVLVNNWVSTECWAGIYANTYGEYAVFSNTLCVRNYYGCYNRGGTTSSRHADSMPIHTVSRFLVLARIQVAVALDARFNR